MGIARDSSREAFQVYWLYSCLYIFFSNKDNLFLKEMIY